MGYFPIHQECCFFSFAIMVCPLEPELCGIIEQAFQRQKFFNDWLSGDKLSLELQVRPCVGFGISMPIEPGSFHGVLIHQVLVEREFRGQQIFTRFLLWLIETMKRYNQTCNFKVILLEAVRNKRFFRYLLDFDIAFISENNINDVYLILDPDLRQHAHAKNFKNSIDYTELPLWQFNDEQPESGDDLDNEDEPGVQQF